MPHFPVLNLFYREPDPDRWLPFDRYPRRIIRRLVRGSIIGGQTRVFLNLIKGLDQIGVKYRVNNYSYLAGAPREIACIVGKPFLLRERQWRNPIVFGAATFSHPIEWPNLLKEFDIRKILVPGPWMKQMWTPDFGDLVVSWPTGIDTKLWAPAADDGKEFDVLLYNKIRWDQKQKEEKLVNPIKRFLKEQGRSFVEIRYGYYREEEFHCALKQCRSMIFLCEHETQGIAYQQALSSDVPIMAWDRQGYWKDPNFYPQKVKFSPVSSVPYWSEQCGIRFGNLSHFHLLWQEFWKGVESERFSPRLYILENLTLEKCAFDYANIVRSIF